MSGESKNIDLQHEFQNVSFKLSQQELLVLISENYGDKRYQTYALFSENSKETKCNFR